MSEPAGRVGRPAVRLNSGIDAVRTEGLAWVLRRLRYRTPSTRTGRALHTSLRALIGTLRSPVRYVPRRPLPRTADDTLYAFYDLAVAHITYDAAWFAAAADLARRRLGLARVHFVVVPGIVNGLREERTAYEAVVDADLRVWRLHNVVVPIFTFVPSCGGYTVLPARAAAEPLRARAGRRVYPASYEPALPVGHHPSELLGPARAGAAVGVLRSSEPGRRFVERWAETRLRGRRMVTITLRDYGYMTERNSDLGAWAAFARRLDPAVYLPVFVLDTERTLDPSPAFFEGFEVFREASWNVGLRMALYESSFVNLGVNNGPLFMAMLSERTRMLIFKMVTPSVPQTTEDFMRQLGFPIGGQLPFATPHQRLVWEDDTLEVIEREFAAMAARLGAAGGTASPAVASLTAPAGGGGR
ncbi:MAG TPA: hypothetical protein VKW09_04410 [bacterium]|nr:hypothetical protein [bacterium]